MKTLISILIISLLGNLARAQDCGEFYAFNEGTVMELTSYDKKDKQDGRLIYKVTQVTDTPEGKKASIQFEMYDKKGDPVELGENNNTTEFAVQCNGEHTMIDIESMMLGNPVLSSYQGMDVTMEGTHIMIPNQLSTGETLPDANLDITVKTGVMNINMNSKIMNRKVVGQEQITTQAGTFNTYVITYDSEFKMGVTQKSSGKQWIAKNIGMVKEEHYNKKGQLTGYTVLTNLEK
jgi:hypothetical protein